MTKEHFALVCCNILIEALAAVAEQERITKRQRQAEGIAAARARGVHLGRPILKLPDDFAYYYKCREENIELKFSKW